MLEIIYFKIMQIVEQEVSQRSESDQKSLAIEWAERGEMPEQFESSIKPKILDLFESLNNELQENKKYWDSVAGYDDLSDDFKAQVQVCAMSNQTTYHSPVCSDGAEQLEQLTNPITYAKSYIEQQRARAESEINEFIALQADSLTHVSELPLPQVCKRFK